MPRRRRQTDYLALLRKLSEAGMNRPPAPVRPADNGDTLLTIDERVSQIMQIVNKAHRPAGSMLFFVMYDIEDNKVRRYVVKYLEKQGCTRVQKSIFLADLPIDRYNAIRQGLTEVQAAYENNDSLLVVPISTDYLRAMKVIGHSIDVDIITHTRNTLFF